MVDALRPYNATAVHPPPVLSSLVYSYLWENLRVNIMKKGVSIMKKGVLGASHGTVWEASAASGWTATMSYSYLT